MEAGTIYENLRSQHQGNQLLDETDQVAKRRIVRILCKLLKWNAVNEILSCTNPVLILANIRHLLYLAQAWAISIQQGSDQSSNTLHMVAISIAKLCYWDWIEDSKLVGDVLNFVYRIDGHFSGIFQRVFDNPNQKYHMWHLSRDSNEIKEFSVAVYFLHHGQRCGLSNGNIRIVDSDLVSPMTVPTVITAIIYVKPKPLLLFLRYGARMYRVKKNHNACMSEWGSALLLRHLVRMLWICLGNKTDSNVDNKSNLTTVARSNNIEKVCLCIRILLRATPQLDKRALDFPLITMNHDRISRYSHSESFVQWVTDQMILPNLATRCYQPSPLQHFCRCRIRQCLNEKSLLPFAIRELKIPELLKRYLDLLID